MQRLDTIHDYLSSHSEEIGARILASYPALHGADEAPSSLLSSMLRKPYPAQTLAIMGVSKRWNLARNANVVAECGAGKTLIALGSMLVHSNGRPFTGLVMAPPHLVEKWARETFLTLPRVRVFLIDRICATAGTRGSLTGSTKFACGEVRLSARECIPP